MFACYFIQGRFPGRCHISLKFRTLMRTPLSLPASTDTVNFIRIYTTFFQEISPSWYFARKICPFFISGAAGVQKTDVTCI